MQALDSLSFRALENGDVPRTAELLGRAFDVDAAYGYLFPDAATRTTGLTHFFQRNLQTHLPYRCTHVAVDAHDRVLATVTLRPPGGVPISLLTMLRRGLLPFALAHGTSAVKRLLWLKDTYDAIEIETAEHAPHAHVHMMAVAKELQGKGLGSRLLRHVLRLHASPAQTQQTVLTTHLPQNVVFYRREGFEVAHERTLTPPQSHPYTVWSMRRATK